MIQFETDCVAKIICKENGDNPRLKNNVGTKWNPVVVPVWHSYREAAEKAIEYGCRFFMATHKE